ncbi:hypothetical protein [Cellulomonas dongxiuzhuiae]|uniref:hypothetical protein n=1 Tax=Cellulomonas dongxiuzhuiae TaxID=2819979 RepID=UPI001AAF0E35|nr:hypothetical protein [Cellulomonas dongxiuzhuiae]MBO3089493.1 hypothetical protein [Cellulomonas dongxiuzhuiae]
MINPHVWAVTPGDDRIRIAMSGLLGDVEHGFAKVAVAPTGEPLVSMRCGIGGLGSAYEHFSFWITQAEDGRQWFTSSSQTVEHVTREWELHGTLTGTARMLTPAELMQPVGTPCVEPDTALSVSMSDLESEWGLVSAVAASLQLADSSDPAAREALQRFVDGGTVTDLVHAASEPHVGIHVGVPGESPPEIAYLLDPLHAEAEAVFAHVGGSAATELHADALTELTGPDDRVAAVLEVHMTAPHVSPVVRYVATLSSPTGESAHVYATEDTAALTAHAWAARGRRP